MLGPGLHIAWGIHASDSPLSAGCRGLGDVAENDVDQVRGGDSVTVDNIQHAVIRLFEDSRQSPGAPYEAERFMAFLTTKPVKKGRRHADTFNGGRGFGRFMNAVQLEFGVFFTNKDLDRGWALDDFVELIQTKMADPDQGMRLARKQLQRDRSGRLPLTIIWSMVATVLIAIPFALTGGLVRSVLGVVWIGAVTAITVYHSRQVAYSRQLVETMESVHD